MFGFGMRRDSGAAWSLGQTPLQRHLRSKTLRPTDAERGKLVRETLIRKSGLDRLEAERRLRENALTDKEARAQAEKEVDEQYKKDLIAWVQGQGKESEHRRTPWGRKNLLLEPVPVPGLEEWMTRHHWARTEMRTWLARMHEFGPAGYDELEMFYRFVVRGEDIKDSDVQVYLDNHRTWLGDGGQVERNRPGQAGARTEARYGPATAEEQAVGFTQEHVERYGTMRPSAEYDGTPDNPQHLAPHHEEEPPEGERTGDRWGHEQQKRAAVDTRQGGQAFAPVEGPVDQEMPDAGARPGEESPGSPRGGDPPGGDDEGEVPDNDGDDDDDARPGGDSGGVRDKGPEEEGVVPGRNSRMTLQQVRSVLAQAPPPRSTTHTEGGAGTRTQTLTIEENDGTHRTLILRLTRDPEPQEGEIEESEAAGFLDSVTDEELLAQLDDLQFQDPPDENVVQQQVRARELAVPGTPVPSITDLMAGTPEAAGRLLNLLGAAGAGVAQQHLEIVRDTAAGLLTANDAVVNATPHIARAVGQAAVLGGQTLGVAGRTAWRVARAEETRTVARGTAAVMGAVVGMTVAVARGTIMAIDAAATREREADAPPHLFATDAPPTAAPPRMRRTEQELLLGLRAGEGNALTAAARAKRGQSHRT